MRHFLLAHHQILPPEDLRTLREDTLDMLCTTLTRLADSDQLRPPKLKTGSRHTRSALVRLDLWLEGKMLRCTSPQWHTRQLFRCGFLSLLMSHYSTMLGRERQVSKHRACAGVLLQRELTLLLLHLTREGFHQLLDLSQLPVLLPMQLDRALAGAYSEMVVIRQLGLRPNAILYLPTPWDDLVASADLFWHEAGSLRMISVKRRSGRCFNTEAFTLADERHFNDVDWRRDELSRTSTGAHLIQETYYLDQAPTPLLCVIRASGPKRRAWRISELALEPWPEHVVQQPQPLRLVDADSEAS